MKKNKNNALPVSLTDINYPKEANLLTSYQKTQETGSDKIVLILN